MIKKFDQSILFSPLEMAFRKWALLAILFGAIFCYTSSALAVSFTLDAGLLGDKYSGSINFTGPTTNLVFAPQQDITYSDYNTSFKFTTITLIPANRLMKLEFSLTNIRPLICGPNNTSCSVSMNPTLQLSLPLPDYMITTVSPFWRSMCGPSMSCGFAPQPTFPKKVTFNPNVTQPVPEPGTILLLSAGLLVLAGYRWYQRRRVGLQVG